MIHASRKKHEPGLVREVYDEQGGGSAYVVLKFGRERCQLHVTHEVDDDGVRSLTGIDVESDHRLDYQLLRQIPTATILAEISQMIDTQYRFAPIELGRKTADGGLDELVLTQVAALYCHLQGGKGPVQRLAAILGVPRATAAHHVLYARQHGLLSSPGRGRAGGKLTAKALALIENDTEEE